MDLFTQQQLEKLKSNGTRKNRDKDHTPVVKLFMPGTTCTWLISEIDPENPDIAFGLCDLGMGMPELGSVSINELEEAKVFGMPVERDFSFVGKYPMSVYAKAARIEKAITDDERLLESVKCSLQTKGNKFSPS